MCISAARRISRGSRAFTTWILALPWSMTGRWANADAAGLYNSPSEMRGTADVNFTGWGRCPTDMETGEYVFETIRPGRVPYKDGRLMAPHVTLWIVARGINIG
eukprot:gene16015-19294_t